MQQHADKKTNLSELLANEFELLKGNTSSTPAGKEAVKKLCKLGKEYSFDATLLQTLPLTCKKEPANRTDFEVMMFSTLKTSIDQQIDSLTRSMAELEPTKADALSSVAAAKDLVEKNEAVQTTASEELTAANSGAREATKEVAKADNRLYQIWADMKEVCDAQDELAESVNTFKENVLAAFQQLKEKEPEPEPVEAQPAEEAEAPE